MTAETLESLRASFNRRLRAEGKAAPFALGTEELMLRVGRNSPVHRVKWNR